MSTIITSYIYKLDENPSPLNISKELKNEFEYLLISSQKIDNFMQISPKKN